MREETTYSRFHPKWYRRRVSVWWWLESWTYTRFVLREITSVAVAFFALVMLWEVRALADGPEAYARFFARLQSPWLLLLHGVAFAFVLFHSLTWFHLAPKAVVLRVRGKRVPDSVIVAMNYLAWIAASGIVVWVVLRG
jgi:fumarate reductase subunit C